MRQIKGGRPPVRPLVWPLRASLGVPLLRVRRRAVWRALRPLPVLPRVGGGEGGGGGLRGGDQPRFKRLQDGGEEIPVTGKGNKKLFLQILANEAQHGTGIYFVVRPALLMKLSNVPVVVFFFFLLFCFYYFIGIRRPLEVTRQRRCGHRPLPAGPPRSGALRVPGPRPVLPGTGAGSHGDSCHPILVISSMCVLGKR